MSMNKIFAGAAILGGLSHIGANKLNNKAETIYKESKEKYDQVKLEMRNSKIELNKSLSELISEKKYVLKTSVKPFLKYFKKITPVAIKESNGLAELSKISLNNEEIVHMSELTNIYSHTALSGVAGASLGALASMVMDGSMPGVAKDLLDSNNAYVNHDYVEAKKKAGDAWEQSLESVSALSVAGSALLASGVVSAIQAAENLEKARTLEAEINAVIEKTNINILMCNAISERTQMYYNLLKEMDRIYEESAKEIIKVIKSKSGFFGVRKLGINDLSEKEQNLLAVTVSLTKAIKTIIDTPILDADGKLYEEPQKDICLITTELETYKDKVNKLGIGI